MTQRTDTVRRYDFLGEAHTDPGRTDGVLLTVDEDTGFLHGMARINRTGNQTYGDAQGNEWVEFRSDAEVFSEATLDSFEGIVITNDHPDEFVTTDNVRELQMGHAKGRPVRDGKFSLVPVVLTDPGTIRDVMSGKLEFSCGYTADVIHDPGVTADGTRFDARQTNIRGNHLALVDRGRAGPECRLLARGDAYQTTEGHTMKKIKMKDGTEREVTDEVHELWLKAVAPDAKKADAENGEEEEEEDQFGKEEEEEDTDEEEDKKGDASVRAELDALRSKVRAQDAAAKHRDANEAVRIDARVRLTANVHAVLGATHDTQGVSDSVLMRQIVLSVDPTRKADLVREKSDAGYLRCAYQQAVKDHATAKLHVDEANGAIYDAVPTSDERDKGLKDSWQKYDDAHSMQPHAQYVTDSKGGK